MEQATEKQIYFAKKLGIENPENFSKMALKELIQGKVEGNPQYQQKAQPQAYNQAPSPSQSNNLVVNRTEAPNSYEFGKAGNRFKLYFEDVKQLQGKIKELQDAGLYTDPLEVLPSDFSKEESNE
jgi:hypothetical protein